MTPNTLPGVPKELSTLTLKVATTPILYWLFDTVTRSPTKVLSSKEINPYEMFALNGAVGKIEPIPHSIVIDSAVDTPVPNSQNA